MNFGPFHSPFRSMNVALALAPLKTDAASREIDKVINTQPPSIPQQLQMFVWTIKSYDTQNIFGRSDHVKYFFGSFIEVICYGDR